jgi:hypothetical protein
MAGKQKGEVTVARQGWQDESKREISQRDIQKLE